MPCRAPAPPNRTSPTRNEGRWASVDAPGRFGSRGVRLWGSADVIGGTRAEPPGLPIEAATPLSGLAARRAADRRYRLRAAAGAAGRKRGRYRGGAGAALSHLLRDHGGAAAARHGHPAARLRRVRPDLRSPARARSQPGQRRRLRRRHLSADPARGGVPLRRVLFGRGIRHRPARRLSRRNSRTRAFLRRCRVSRPSGDAAAVERHRRLCLPLRHRADVRLRQPAGHRSRGAGGAALVSLLPPSGAAGVAGAGAARALCRDAPARPRADRPEPHARCVAAADQGLSAARRLCRRRRGDRRAVQHDRHLHRRQDRSRRPRNTRAITSANRKTRGPPRWAAWTASAPRRCGSGGSARISPGPCR